MTVDNYDPAGSLSAYYPSRAGRVLARIWAREKTLHDWADFGAVRFFEGGGSDPTALSGYATDKLWLRVDEGVTDEAATVRYYAGGPASLLASWPELDREGFAAHLGAKSAGELDIVWSTAISGDPGTGKVRGNHATLASITSIAISKTGRQGQSYSARIALMDDDDIVRVYGAGDDSSYVDVRITGAPSDQTTYYTIPCAVRAATSLSDGHLVGLSHHPSWPLLDATDIDVATLSPSNYSSAGPSVEEHLAAIDTALGTGGMVWRTSSWGIQHDGTDERAALQAMINAAAAAGAPVEIWFDGIVDCGAPVTNHSGVPLRGAAGDVVGIRTKSDAGTVTPLLDYNDVLPDIVGIHIIGNGDTVAASSAAGAVDCQITTASTSDLNGGQIRQCTISNFGHTIWCQVRITDNPNINVTSLVVSDNTWLSVPGNIRFPTNIGGQSTMLFMDGYAYDLSPPVGGDIAGLIVAPQICNNYVDAVGVKQFLEIFGAVRDPFIANNYIKSAGANASEGFGSYAIICYSSRYLVGGTSVDARYDVKRPRIVGNSIIDPRDCGVYCASVEGPYIAGNYISGQLSDADASLPLAAIGLNGPIGGTRVINNTLSECYRGITVVTLPDGANVAVEGNTITSSISGITVFGIKIGGSNVSTNTRVRCARNIVTQTGSEGLCVYISTSAASPLGTLIIEANVVTSAYRALWWYDANTSYVARGVYLRNNVYSGACAATQVVLQNIASVLSMVGDFYDMTDCTASYGLNLIGSSRIELKNVTFANKPNNAAAYALATHGGACAGTIDGVEFINIVDGQRVVAGGLGTSKPTHASTRGQFVQNLTFPSSTASLQTMGWVASSTSGTWYALTALSEILTGSATYDPASLADGSGVTTTVSVAGAALGDYVLVSHAINVDGITVTAWVSAADTVSVRFQNESGGTLDIASGTLRTLVIQV